MSLERIALLAARGERTGPERGELRRLLGAYDPSAVFEFATENHVAHVVGAGLKEEGWLDAGAWLDELSANGRAKTALFAGLDELFAELHRTDIPAAMIESAGVAAHVDMPGHALGSGDADVLVEPGALPNVSKLLASLGYEPGRRSRRTQTSRVEWTRGSTRIEVGDVAFERAWTPLPFAARERAWLRHSVNPRPGSAIRTPRTEDLLVQVATHTSMHSFVRAPGLRLHVDVERIVRSCVVDWDRVFNEALELRAGARIWLSLHMASSLLGAPVPPEILARLRPNETRARGLLSLVDRHGVFVSSSPKLPAGEAILLDLMLEDASPVRWFARNALPEHDWLRRRFGRDDESAKSRVRLQLRRLAAAARRWDPR